MDNGGNKKMKVQVIEGYNTYDFEQKVNWRIQELKERNNQIIDIKFSVRKDPLFEFFAMIIYK